MDKGAMKEPAASTPVWDELKEWTGGRIQEWMQQLLVEEVTGSWSAASINAVAWICRAIATATESRGG